MLFNWYKIEERTAASLEEGKVTEAVVGPRTIALLLRREQVLAFSPTCPHSGARLCEGWLDAMGRIVCPLHQYRFDPSNGRNTSGEGYKLRTFPVEVRDGYIYVGLTE